MAINALEIRNAGDHLRYSRHHHDHRPHDYHECYPHTHCQDRQHGRVHMIYGINEIQLVTAVQKLFFSRNKN